MSATLNVCRYKSTLKDINQFKREERGSSDYRMPDDVFVCRWNDNDVVTVATNFENWALTSATRWSNEKKSKNFNPPAVSNCQLQYAHGWGG